MQRLLILVLATILLIAVAIVALKKPSPSPKSVPVTAGGPTVLLLGTTNFPAGSTGARFYLTNSTDEILVCSPAAIEYEADGKWVNQPFVGKAIWRATRDWAGFQEELKPRSAFTFTVPGPTNKTAWRVVVRCQQRAVIRDTVADVVSDITATNAAQENARQYSGKLFSLTSPAVLE